jgi:hypothetical protein
MDILAFAALTAGLAAAMVKSDPGVVNYRPFPFVDYIQ